MRRLATIGCLLFVATAAAGPGHKNIGATQADHLNTVASLSVFQLLPAGAGVSTSHVNDFCEMFASEMTGNYFCKDGDSNTGLTLSAVGSPTTQTDGMCPNGANCESVTGYRLDGSNRFTTASAAPPSGSISCATFMRPDSQGTFATAVVGGAASFYLARTNSADTWEFAIWNEAGVADVVDATPIAGSGARQHVLAGFSYQYVGAGTSVGKVYVNGTLGSTNSAMVGPMRSTSIQRGLAAEIAGTNPLEGVYAVAFCTDKVIDAATWTAMSSALIPSVRGTRGEVITTTRASVRTCCKRDGTACSNIPANMPCAHDAALDVSGDVGQLLVRSNEYNVAPWGAAASGAAVPTVTANAALARDGTKTAEQMDFPVATAGQFSSRFQSVAVTSGTAYTMAHDVKAIGSSATLYLTSSVAATGLDCTSTSCSVNTSGYTRCAHTFTPSSSVDYAMFISNSPTCTTPGGAAASVYVSATQLNVGSVALPYCPSEASPTTCLADTVTVPTTAGWPAASGAVRLTYVPTVTSGTVRILVDANDGTNGWDAYLGTAGEFVFELRNAGASTYCNSASTGVLSWTAGQAYRLRAEWGGTTARLYRDEALVGSCGSMTPPASVAATAYVGSLDGALQLNGTVAIDSVSR